MGNIKSAFVGETQVFGKVLPFIPPHTPYGYWDGLNPDSFDSDNDEWKDLAEVNTTDPSTWSTILQGSFPTHNSNGYWEIRESPSLAGMALASSGTTTNPFSYFTDTDHTLFAYVRPITFDGSAVDVLGTGTSAGGVLLGFYDVGSGDFARGHVWATSAQFTDTDLDSVSLNKWYVLGQRYVTVGAQKRVDVILSEHDSATTTIVEGTAFTPGSVTNSPQPLRTGRNTEVKGENDLAAVTLYRTALSDSEVGDVVTELKGRFATPT